MEATLEKEKSISARRISVTNRRRLRLPDKILRDFIVSRSKKSLKELRGKISFRDGYDYKLMRS